MKEPQCLCIPIMTRLAEIMPGFTLLSLPAKLEGSRTTKDHRNSLGDL